MQRRAWGLVLATCVAGCGTLLGGLGDDAEDQAPTPVAKGDASGGLDGAGDATIGIGDPGASSSGAADASMDAKLDGASASDGGKTDASTSVNPCSGAALCERFVFVSSKLYAANFGAGNANNICRGLADLSTNPAMPGRQWRAWISTPTKNARTNLGVQGLLRYKRVDGTTIADDFTNLTDGSLDAPIVIDENGAMRTTGVVWTGSGQDGLYVSAPGNCNDFASAVNGSAKAGDPNGTGGNWSDSGNQPCSLEGRLYCFEY